MTDTLLVLNAGSSSIKFALYQAALVAQGPLLSGKITSIGRAPEFTVRDASGLLLAKSGLAENGLSSIEKSASHGELTRRFLNWLKHHDHGTRLVAVGHRVVHGGRVHADPVLITDDVMAELEQLSSLAPLHQPHNLAAIRAISEWSPCLPQVACFDTSFHRTQPRLAQLFALPRALSDAGVIRYGFHGLSYQYIASVLPQHLGERANGRVVVAHLGNGASLCAIKQGCSIASSMGFTALDGLMMGQRCGSIDPGVVLYLLQNQGMSVEQVQHLLYHESGLLGVSGISNNMQVLRESSEPHAREAIELFCYRAASELCAMLSPLQGLDAIVFTAGIGENAALVRQLICQHLAWLGVELDPAANDKNASRISSASSKIDVLVIPTDEETVIAEATRELLKVTQPSLAQ